MKIQLNSKQFSCKHQSIVAAVTMLLSLSGCSSSSNNTSTSERTDSISSEPLKYITEVRVSDSAQPTNHDFWLSANAKEFEQPIERQDFVEALNRAYTLIDDDCDTGGTTVGEFIYPTQAIDIQVGDSAIFSSPGGTFATADYIDLAQSGEPLYFYGSVQASEHTPNGLMVDYPDGIMGKIKNQPIVDVSPMTMISPTAEDESDLTNEVRWQPGDGNYIWLHTGTNLGPINCLLVDDGSFTLPELTSGLDHNFEHRTFNISRTKLSMVDRGDTLFISIRTSSFFNYDI